MAFGIVKINAQLFANRNTCGMKRTHFGRAPEGLNERTVTVGWRVLPAGAHEKIDPGWISKMPQPA